MTGKSKVVIFTEKCNKAEYKNQKNHLLFLLKV
jgi:hypothetical protein